MTEKTPWHGYRTTREGVVDVYAKPRMSLRRKIGATAALCVMGPWAGLQADIVYSSVTTVQSNPDTTLAQGSIPCDNADAVIFVSPGYGIQNADLTAEKIAPLANEKNMCTRYVTYGTTANVDILAEKKAEVLRSSRRLERAANPNLKPNDIEIGESLGGIIAARTRNKMVEEYGNEFAYPVLADDATPSGGEAVRWGNPTIAEMVARNCQWFRAGDLTMTLITVLTDPDPERRALLLDPQKGPEFFWRVYAATKSASMQLRIHESCEVGKGYPVITQNMENDQITEVLYAYADGDPIVDGSISKEVIRDRAGSDYFQEIHMTGDGVDGNHAAAWYSWPGYERYYQEILDTAQQIIRAREDTSWQRDRISSMNQPR